MGMFDTLLVLGYKCPYCGAGGKVDFQTKDADCSLSRYYVHEPGTFKWDGKDSKKVWKDFLKLYETNSELRAQLKPAMDRVGDLGVALLQSHVELKDKRRKLAIMTPEEA
jgi:hypothetical protein